MSILTPFKMLSVLPLPKEEEVESFGALGEEQIYRKLCQKYRTVIPNPILPLSLGFSEKDILLIDRGVWVVIEVKNWKGDVYDEGATWVQRKKDGVEKKHKSPVASTLSFCRQMEKYYGTDAPVYGMVVLLSADRVSAPMSEDGIEICSSSDWQNRLSALLNQGEKGGSYPEQEILRCSRFYGTNGRRFIKGLLTDNFFTLYDKHGTPVSLDLTTVQYISVKKRFLRLRRKLTVTFYNGTSTVLYGDYVPMHFATLDGKPYKTALHKGRYLVL